MKTTVQDCGFCAGESRKVKTTSRKSILKEYKSMFGIEFTEELLSANFGFDAIVTYECVNCRTISYSPKALGNSSYYDYLSRQLPWYYLEQRWEYPIALEFLKNEAVKRFVEVGCGAGHFLRLARVRGITGHGCEINVQAIDTLRKEGFTLVSDLPDKWCQYDALVMFQVLEHLADPYGFMKSLLRHVKRGGVALVSAPLTPSCASFNRNVFLLPPHHQSLPTTTGFQFLAERLGVRCESITCDPPESYRVGYALRKAFGEIPFVNKLLHRKRFEQLMAKTVLRVASMMGLGWAKVGHTGLAVFRLV